jgi:hypothetical protein
MNAVSVIEESFVSPAVQGLLAEWDDEIDERRGYVALSGMLRVSVWSISALTRTPSRRWNCFAHSAMSPFPITTATLTRATGWRSPSMRHRRPGELYDLLTPRSSPIRSARGFRFCVRELL